MLDVKYEGLGSTGLVTTPLNMEPNLSECNVSHGGIAHMFAIPMLQAYSNTSQKPDDREKVQWVQFQHADINCELQ